MVTIQGQCCVCNDENESYICVGCRSAYCFTHLSIHRQKIKQEFPPLENDFKLFRQTLIQRKTSPNKIPIIDKINQWEYNSIQKIRQAAEQCRQRLINYTNQYIVKIENKFNDLFEQLGKLRKANKFNELDLYDFKDKLNTLKTKLDKPSNILIEENKSSEFIQKISVVIPAIDHDTKWKQNAVTIAGGNNYGNHLNQFSGPYGMCMDDDNQTMYIADCFNHRIIEWKVNTNQGRIVAGGNGQGNQMDQLDGPVDVLIDKKTNSLIISDQGNRRVMQWSRQKNTENGQVIISDIDCLGITMDKYGDLYVADCVKNEVKRWRKGEKDGIIVAGGNGLGDLHNQLNFPTYIVINDDLSLYISDHHNHRVMKWTKDAKEGIVVAGGHGQGNSSAQLSSPYGLILDQLGQIYIADSGNDRIMRWCEEDEEGYIIAGGKGKGKQSYNLNNPIGLAFDYHGSLYAVDLGNHRVQKFDIA